MFAVYRAPTLNFHPHKNALLFSVDKIKTFKNFKKKVQTAAAEDDLELTNSNEITLAEGLRPVPGGPFSALTPSMWPQDILIKLGQPEVGQF